MVFCRMPFSAGRRASVSLCSVQAVAVTIVASALSCQSNQNPCYGLNSGDRVAITVLYPYEDTGSAKTCGFGVDLDQGTVLVATVGVVKPDPVDTCAPLVAQYAPFGTWTWMLRPSNAGSSNNVFSGAYTATNGTCAANVNVAVAVNPSADPFGPAPDTGTTPNVTLLRIFGGSGAAGCPSECIDDFAVSLKKL
jgi:hypothetical protein